MKIVLRRLEVIGVRFINESNFEKNCLLLLQNLGGEYLESDVYDALRLRKLN
ncbi:MAG: hypothetical protein V7K69_00035 [Nostoc sp.]|uniref:hypothetical protein n=1 Tax=Nostoc sp. TaxID=1180 RepID=UPI002FF587D5